MVAVPSTMQALGSPAADFDLPDVTQAGESVRLSDFHGQPLLVMFICNHCPFVVHIMGKMAEIANRAKDQGFAVVAISSNDIESYPQDGPGPMRDFALNWGFQFPYLLDETQDVAKHYRAACTPDFFVFDGNHLLQYRGQMDGSRPGNSVIVDGSDLSDALECVLSGVPVDENQTPSIGCNIKWRAGNEPDYF